MRQALPAAGLALTLLTTPGAGPLPGGAAGRLPGVGASDGRVVVDGTQPPWTGVARLQVPGVSRCSAIVIAPRTVLTAAHCLWNRRLGHFAPPGTVHVLTRYTAGSFAHHAIAVRYWVPAGLDFARHDVSHADDVAVVTLADPVGADSLSLAPGPVQPAARAMLGGYNQDRAEVIEADTACAILRVNTLLVHNCTATRGTSGGPLLVRDDAGMWRVAGLQIGAFTDHAGGVAIPAATLLSALDHAAGIALPAQAPQDGAAGHGGGS